jgi:hypothetical protein
VGAVQTNANAASNALALRIGAEETARAAALEALKTSGAPNPGAGNPAEGGKDYMTLIEEYRAQYKCTKTAAMMAINKSHPGKRTEYLEKNNPGLAIAK